MGSYHIQRCPICGAAIQTDVAVERCPACKEYILDRLDTSGDGTGLNTASTEGTKRSGISTTKNTHL